MEGTYMSPAEPPPARVRLPKLVGQLHSHARMVPNE